MQQWVSKSKVLLLYAIFSCTISPIQCSVQQSDESATEALNFINENYKKESELPLLSTHKHFNENQGYVGFPDGINGTILSDNPSKTLTLFYAFISATLVGLSGVVPLMFLNTG